jgi:hypothetical protein
MQVYFARHHMRNQSEVTPVASISADTALYDAIINAQNAHEVGYCTRLKCVHIAPESPAMRVGGMGVISQSLQLSVVRI